MIITDSEYQQLLETIIEIAGEIGWTSALVQGRDGEVIGMYIGTEDWIKIKVGAAAHVTH